MDYPCVTYDAICACIRGRQMVWRFTNNNGDWDFETVNTQQLDGYLVLLPMEEDTAVRPVDEVEMYKIYFRENWFFYDRIV